MTISHRVMTLSVVLILLVAAASITGIVAMRTIGNELEDIAETDVPLTGLIADIEVHQLQQEVILEKMLRAAKISNANADLKNLEKNAVSLNDRIRDEIRKAEGLAEKMIASARNPETRREGEKLLGELRKVSQDALRYQREVEELVRKIDAGDIGAAEQLAGLAQKDAESLGLALEAILKEVGQFTEAAARHAEHAEQTAMRTLVAVFVVGSALGGLFAFFIGRSISRPLRQMQETIGCAARDKDLTLRADASRDDEVGLTARAFNELMQSFQQVLAQVSQSAESVAATSEEMAAASQQVASASQQQAEAASSMAAAVEEMTVSIGQISDHSSEAQQRADETNDASSRGEVEIGKLLADISHVAESVRSSAATISQLDERSKEIQSIVGVISGIAEQTNLLALNAAIEAARAGESGRGFAVVADEVRKLAERSRTATKEIAAIIDSIQKTTQQAVSEMSHEVREVNAEAETASGVGQMLSGMRECSRRMTSAIHDVSAALKEQSTASTELARHVERIAQMTEENNAAVQETATAATVLSDHASRLQSMIGQFRVA